MAPYYPTPGQYNGVEGVEEMDELLTVCEEDYAGLDASHFPRRLMRNFHIYDAERVTGEGIGYEHHDH